MIYKILMLGGRHSGKSSILAALFDALEHVPNDMGVFTDETDYTVPISGNETIPLLSEKQYEVRDFIRGIKHFDRDLEFVIDFSPNRFLCHYTLEYKLQKGNEILCEFMDYPGEFLAVTHPQNVKIRDSVAHTDVFIVAIDTPYLMSGDEELNQAYNRINEITQLLEKMPIKNSEDRKLIVLCPVKCERWVNEGRIEEVTERIYEAYASLIRHATKDERVEFWISPIQTVGGVSFSQLNDAQVLYEGSDDKQGIPCSVEPLTNVVKCLNGQIMSGSRTSTIEPDLTAKIGVVDIPRAWYKVNRNEFATVHVEQLAYQFWRFILHKERSVRLHSPRWLPKFLRRLLLKFSSIDLSAYMNIYEKIDKEEMIKKDIPGYRKIG